MHHSNDQLHAAKAECRQRVKTELNGITANDRARWSAQICELLMTLPVWSESRDLLLYSPMTVEVDTGALFLAGRSQGKSIYLPRLHGDEMVFHASTPDPLEEHSYGMMEPPEDSPLWPGAHGRRDRDDASPAGRPVLVICPGLAFDRAGRRLGRGKAFYDRFLHGLELAGARNQTAVIGICFGVQLLSEVPAGSADERVDGVVTELGFVETGDS